MKPLIHISFPEALYFIAEGAFRGLIELMGFEHKFRKLFPELTEYMEYYNEPGNGICIGFLTIFDASAKRY